MAGYVPITINPGRDFLDAFTAGLSIGRGLKKNQANKRIGAATSEAYSLYRDIRSGKAEPTSANMAKVDKLLGEAIAAAPAAGLRPKEISSMFPQWDEMLLDRTTNLLDTAITAGLDSDVGVASVAGVATLLSGEEPKAMQLTEDGRLLVVPGNAKSEAEVMVLDPETLTDFHNDLSEGGVSLSGMQVQLRQANDSSAGGAAKSGAVAGQRGQQLTPLQRSAVGHGKAAEVIAQQERAMDREAGVQNNVRTTEASRYATDQRRFGNEVSRDNSIREAAVDDRATEQRRFGNEVSRDNSVREAAVDDRATNQRRDEAVQLSLDKKASREQQAAIEARRSRQADMRLGIDQQGADTSRMNATTNAAAEARQREYAPQQLELDQRRIDLEQRRVDARENEFVSSQIPGSLRAYVQRNTPADIARRFPTVARVAEANGLDKVLLGVAEAWVRDPASKPPGVQLGNPVSILNYLETDLSQRQMP